MLGGGGGSRCSSGGLVGNALLLLPFSSCDIQWRASASSDDRGSGGSARVCAVYCLSAPKKRVAASARVRCLLPSVACLMCNWVLL